MNIMNTNELELLPIGYALHEMIFKNGRPHDYRFLYVNKEFEKLTGLKRKNILYKTVKEVLPGIDKEWIENYGRVVKSGKSLKFSHYSTPLKKHYDVTAYKQDKDKFVTAFVDITENKIHADEMDLKAKFQKIIAGISSISEKISEKKFIESVSKELRDFAKFSNFERANLFLFSEDGKFITNIAEWKEDYLDSKKKNLRNVPITKFPKIKEKIEAKNPFFSTNIKKLGKGYVREKNHFKLEKINSIVCIPLISHYRESYGFIGLTNTNSLSDDFIVDYDSLNTIANLFSVLLQKRESHKNLIESEERFRILLKDISSVAVQGYGTNGNVIYWNKASEKLYGYTEKEATGKNLIDLIIPDEAKDNVRKEISSMVKKKVAPKSSELMMKHKSGKLIPVYSNHTLVKLKDRPMELFCLDIDLTENKKNIEELNYRKKELEIITNNISDILLKLDTEGRYLYISKSHKKLLGRGDELLGKKTFNFIHKDDLPKVMEAFGKIIKSNKKESVQYRYLHSKGYYVWLESIGKKYLDYNNNIVIQVSSRDITDIKEKENLLLESKKRYDQMNEVHETVVWEVDTKGKFTYVNHVSKQVYGYLPNVMINNMHFYDLFPAAKRKKFKSEIFDMMKKGIEIDSLDNERITKSGKNIWVSSNGVPIYENNKLVGYRGADTNITSEKQLEFEKLRELNYQKIISSTPSNFVNLDKIKFNGSIDLFLKKIQEFFVSDRAYIFEFEQDAEKISCSYEVCKKGIKPFKKELQNIDYNSMKWWFGQIKNKKPILINDVDDLPKQANFEKREFKHQGIKSLVSFPMVDDDNNLLGFIGLDYVVNKNIFTKDDASKLNIISSILSNIFTSKKIRKTLIESEERYSRALSGMNDGLWDWDVEKDRVFFSPVWKSILGYKENEIKNEFSEFVRLLHPEDKERVLEYVNSYVSNPPKDNFKIEFRMRHKSGKYIEILSRASSSKKKNGKIVRFVGTHIDVTKNKELSMRNSLLSGIIEQVESTIVITDTDANITYANPYFEKSTGYKVKDAIGQNPRILSSGKQSKEYYIELWKTISSGKVWSGKFINKKKNGKLYTEAVTITPIKDKDSKIVNYIAIKYDITEFELIQAQLEKSKEELQEKVMMLEKFKENTIDSILDLKQIDQENKALKKELKKLKK